MSSVDPELDAARTRVMEHGLVAEAVGQLVDVVSGGPMDALAPVKQLLKRFFSDAPWSAQDDEALADAIGPGTGGDRHELEPGLTLEWGWPEGRFRLRVAAGDSDPAPPGEPLHGGADLAETFDGAVVPEATPSPRTIRFATPAQQPGPSRSYDSGQASVPDARVARLLREFSDVTNVLVGPGFVAVTIAHPRRWETLLLPVLRAVTEEFTGGDERPPPDPVAPVTMTLRAASGEPEDEPAARARRLERPWVELGPLRADRPRDLDRVLAATRDPEPARRQVAAALLADAPSDPAVRAWSQLLADRSRAVRRSVVDAVAGAQRAEVRDLLERALGDSDAWVRWKALRGLAGIGAGASRAAIEGSAADPDFRVRLEAARLLAQARSG